MDFFRKKYVSAAARRARRERAVARFQKKGPGLAPVTVEGRRIAHTFWGKAWCENLERYSDFANRLPRGRSYLRNGSVIDLQISPGAVSARVSGTALYRVSVRVGQVLPEQWNRICADCAGQIDSLIELLQGRLSDKVMGRICQPQTGLFPSPAQIEFSCTCPDWASMCKHVAAVLYGIGTRLDAQPELLFVLRQVDQQDLIAKGGLDLTRSRGSVPGRKVLDVADLSALFGIEVAETDATSPEASTGPKVRRRRGISTRS